VEDPRNLVAIHPSFDKLLTALRSAVANEYKLDKEATSFNDILLSFIPSVLQVECIID
jgi:hypothetical protein